MKINGKKTAGFVALIFGMALVIYPFVSNYLMSKNQSSEIAKQEQSIDDTDLDALEKMLEEVNIYNRRLLGDVSVTYPFDPNVQPERDVDYDKLLNINEDSIMAVVEIPKISVKLPVYHGTEDSTLLKGLGHLQKTSLPVGGFGTHSVITGHTGLPSARLFTDLNKLEKGDVFFIHVLGNTLAYEVDLIKTVSPDDVSDLTIDSKYDRVTLLTCTPYGINTHRLLVRGNRIPYEQAEIINQKTEPVVSSWMDEYTSVALMAFAIILLLVGIYLLIRRGDRDCVAAD